MELRDQNLKGAGDLFRHDFGPGRVFAWTGVLFYIYIFLKGPSIYAEIFSRTFCTLYENANTNS